MALSSSRLSELQGRTMEHGMQHRGEANVHCVLRIQTNADTLSMYGLNGSAIVP